MSTQVFDFSQKGGLTFLRENFGKVFWGGDLMDPNSRVNRAIREFACENLAGMDVDSSPDQATWSDLPEDFTDLLRASYVTWHINNAAALQTIAGSCSAPSELNLIVPLGAFASANFSWGGDGSSGVSVEYHLTYNLFKDSAPGTPSGNKSILVIAISYDHLNPEVEDMPTISVRSAQAISKFWEDAQRGSAFKKASDSGLLNLTDDTTSFISDEADIQRCKWLVLPIKSSFSVDLTQGQIGVAIPVDPEEDCSFSYGGELRYGVITEVQLYGQNLNEEFYSIMFMLPSGDNTSYAMDQICDDPGTEEFQMQTLSCDSFYATYEEAHEAYPDLFPLEPSDTGLSATKKHFIRIS